ncbi:ABC transporter ATP-binding protein [Pillotina sp. SPG140]|jgi:ABC-type nitrate/sulfonate/bicarbonate transport system ATPase subunit
MTDPPLLFACEHISKAYAGVPVIHDINLELPERSCVSLVGPSGVGKTTLFNILAGLDNPDAGKVLLQGASITGIPGKISYMLQRDLLLEYRTIIDNVILPLLIRGEKKSIARAYAAPFFEPFGLSGYEKKYPSQLSGGMRQRAAFLRTLMAHNTVILLDEPFSALDALTRMQMHRWYKKIARDMQITTIFITHDVDEALLLSNTVYVINGKPGTITTVVNVPPQSDDLSLSLDCIHLKRLILNKLLNL